MRHIFSSNSSILLALAANLSHLDKIAVSFCFVSFLSMFPAHLPVPQEAPECLLFTFYFTFYFAFYFALFLPSFALYHALFPTFSPALLNSLKHEFNIGYHFIHLPAFIQHFFNHIPFSGSTFYYIIYHPVLKRTTRFEPCGSCHRKIVCRLSHDSLKIIARRTVSS